MGFLSGLGVRLGIGGHGGKLPAGNSQWAQLANFFPQDDKTANGLDLATFYGGGTPVDKKGQHIDVASVLSALGQLGGEQQAPQQPPPPDWGPIAQPRFRDMLNGAPRMQQQQMPPPASMRPYLWGNG